MPRTVGSHLLRTLLCLVTLVVVPRVGLATDVDGPGDCSRTGTDFGDAPEGFDAYPGTLGRFPTCLGSTASAGGQELSGCGPFSSAPGAAAGYVRHVLSPSGIWLGCQSGSDLGIDIEPDAKTSVGTSSSFCSGLIVDCQQTAFGLTFGQDECYTGNDAGLVTQTSFIACSSGQLTIRINNCSSPRTMFLNVLIDFNHDGDWNDAEVCQPSGNCAREWAVINQSFSVPAGCSQRASAAFVVGSTVGPAWMRITLSEQAAPPDFPWNGTASLPGGEFGAGETEDYPVHIVDQGTCPSYTDFGDAPEGQTAYSNGVVGHFPTCLFPTGPGTMNVTVPCPVNSTVPVTTGFVRHVATPSNPDQFWLGCPVPGGSPPDAVDSEINGKMNLVGGGTPSDCTPAVITDCTETLPGLNFGQDECYGDDDAGVAAPFVFDACQFGVINFEAYSCAQQDILVYVNILVDWNQDGDWNDNLQCPNGPCAAEWAIKNAAMTLVPGCNNLGVTPIRVGPDDGQGWMRITITRHPVTDDFPWLGSAGMPGGVFDGGETEDYPFTINPDPGIVDPGPYNDRGDAPEEFLRYPQGLGSEGKFPTCTSPALASTEELLGCGPLSSPPGPSGFVNHVHPGPPAPAAWLGCGNPGVDSEPDGKTNVTSVLGQISHCDNTTIVDCNDATTGISYGADECPGDGDAGIASPLFFQRCAPMSFTYTAANATQGPLAMYLNVLVDWNDDGDWNDVDNCPFQGGCAPEWAVKNDPITLSPGCNTLGTPTFLTGRSYNTIDDLGRWMRVTLTFQPVGDDFPWAGSANLPGQSFPGGETEDYVFYMDGETTPCLDFVQDMGDAPENLTAYPGGAIGRFPTCSSPTALPSTQTFPAGCSPPSTSPLASGHVVHAFLQTAAPFWLGCATSPPPFAIDHENDGKVNLVGAGSGGCDPNAIADCASSLGSLTFGQDECYGDLDAGLVSQVVFTGCATTTFTYKAELCADQTVGAYLNVLVDWNRDGDWNDVERCGAAQPCAPEWAVKNHLVQLGPGCATYQTPPIQAAGPNGPVWMRVTLTPNPVNDDFPWAGSTTGSLSYFESGETEDYIALVQGSPVDVEMVAIPELQFGPAMPNPSRDLTSVPFALPRAGDVRISVYDAAGRLVRKLVNEQRPAGQHSVSWDYRDAEGRQVAAGVYLVQLQFAGRVMTQRIVRLP